MSGKRAILALVMVLLAVTSVAAPAIGQVANEPAELEINQPRHVTQSVNQMTENGTQIYEVRGQYLEIRPQNFNTSDVTAFSVREDEGTLTLDKQSGEYVLNNQGTAGTYHLRWTVSEENETREYVAQIHVIQADYTHVPSDEYENLTAENTKNAELIEDIRNSGDPDTPVEQKVEFGNDIRNFAANPFSALTGQFMALQTIRFITPAGWLDLGINILLVYALTRGLYSTIARLRKQLESEEKIRRREDQLYIKQFKSVLAGQQMTDVDGIDDHQAAVLEERLGTNLYTSLKNFWSVWGADSLKRMYASAMGSIGYAVRVHRDDTGQVESLDVIDPDDRRPVADGGDDADDGPEIVGLGKANEDILDALTWEQVDDRIFHQDPNISAVDHLMVANRDTKRDLISEMSITIPEDFQSRQNFMEAIGNFLQHVQESDFTDEENRPKEDRATMNNLMAFATVMDQQFDVPMDLYWRAVVWNADNLSRDDEAESVLDDITDAESFVDELDGTGGDGVGS